MNYGKRGIKERQAALNARGPKWSRKFFLLIAEAACIALIGICVIVAALGIGVFKGILSTAPDISKITVTPTGQSSFIYDRDGKQIEKLIAENSNRILVSSEQIPDDLKHAFVAIEDARFYNHNGIDIQGIIAAGVEAITSGGLGRGASTITQQLIKNNVFTDWTSEDNNIEKIKRKIQEQYLAVQLEKTYDKDYILVNYLNTINLGQNTLGVEAASRRYFSKHCSELTLSECAVIAGITQNPSKYNPIIHPDNNRAKQEIVLEYMLEQGYITEAEYKAAIADDVYSRIQETNVSSNEDTAIMSYFGDAVVDQVLTDLQEIGYTKDQAAALLYAGGLKIYSTMDSRIQAICDEEFSNPENYGSDAKWLLKYALTIQKADGTLVNHSTEMMRSYLRKSRGSKFNMIFASQDDAKAAIEEYIAAVLEEGDEVYAESIEMSPQPQTSFTIEDQYTGEIVAMIGGRGEKDRSRSLNRATTSMRQPGSCFKVLSAFGPAIDACGFTLADTYLDAPFTYYDGTPVSNWYGEQYRDLQSIRAGIYNSLNIVAVKTLTQIGPELGFNYLMNLGFTTLEEAKEVGDMIYTDIGQPLALGGITNGVYNVELNAAYAAIANHGVYIEPKLYTLITDSDGNVIIDNTATIERRVFSEQTAFLLTSAMQDCVKIGTGTKVKLPGMSLAAKTGTTSDEKDVWYACFTPYYTATVWSGYDNNEVLSTAEQRTNPNMMQAVMRRVHEDLEDPGFYVPQGLVKCVVCSQSGLLPREGLCNDCLREEYFTPDTVPTEYCDVHYAGTVCAYDGLMATSLCPFAHEGIATLKRVEDESLWQGSTILSTELDPLATGAVLQQATTTSYCHHDEAFFAQENWEAIVEQEQNEINARAAAAAAAAAPTE